jgi:UDP-glucuronate 4-epimerase
VSVVDRGAPGSPGGAVLVTGASGFVGLALVEHLLERGERVVGIDLAPPPSEALTAFDRLPGRFEALVADVRDPLAIADVMRRHAPDRLVLLAAVTAGAARERERPASIFEVNVGGTLTALSVAAVCRPRRIVVASSGAVYGASGATEPVLHEGCTPTRPESLYGISKLAAEQAALRLAELHGLDLVVGRLGTCFGPWEADTGVRDTPSPPLQALRHAERGEPAVLPRAVRRDWLYVRDAAAGLAALLDAPSPRHRAYNVGAGFMGTLAEWCGAIAPAFPGWSWRLAAAGEPANVDAWAGYDRAPMAIDRLLADTTYTPRYDLTASAADHLAWRARCGPTDRRPVDV